MFQSAASKNINPNIVLIFTFLLIGMGMLISDMYLPSLPAMTHDLHASTHQVQTTITCYFLGFSLSQLFYGPLSDQIGRRKIILFGLGIGVIGSAFCVFATSIHALMIGRLIQGLGVGAGATLARTIARDVFSGTKLAQIGSFMGTIMAVAPAIAPIMGGYVQVHLGWEANFIILLIINLIMGLAVYWLLPETNIYKQHSARLIELFLNYPKLLANKQFMGFSLVSCCAGAGVIAYLVVSPFLFQTRLGLSPVQYGWLSLFITGALVLGSLINGMLVLRMGLNKMIITGLILMVLSGFIMLIFAVLKQFNVLVIVLPMMIFIVGSKLIYANAFSGALEPFAKTAGTAGALYGCLAVVGSTIASGIMSTFKSQDQTILALVLLIIGLLGVFSFYSTIIRKQKNASGLTAEVSS